MTISVASGKGGTGKTTVATNLALALNDNVQFLDCDVEAPNAFIFLKPTLNDVKPVYSFFPQVVEEKCNFCGLCSKICEWNAIAVVNKKWLFFSQLCHSCSACWQLCPEKALKKEKKLKGVVEKGKAFGIDFVQGKLTVGEAVSPPVIKAVKKEINKEKIVIIDVAPGTGCPMVEGVKESDFCILVTEPTPFGFNDLILAIGVLKELTIPFGVVINRSDIGDDKVEDFCRKNNIPVLLRLPFDRKIARAYSEGKAIVKEDKSWKEKFIELFEKIKEEYQNTERAKV